MAFVISIAALCFLMYVAYRGYSVVLFAPIAALAAVLLTAPAQVLPVYSDLFMDKAVVFVKLYFPAFLLGALFGKVIELSGFARSITIAVIKMVGRERAVLSMVLVGMILTYGGVSLFVVVFAIYPFCAEMFRQGDIPKRLIPVTIALGAFTITMDSLPGTPQIQNVIPTSFFGTDLYAAPIVGTIGGLYTLVLGVLYIEWQMRKARKAGEGYGEGHIMEPEIGTGAHDVNPLLAIAPLVLVGVANWVFTKNVFPAVYLTTPGVTDTMINLGGIAKPIAVPVQKMIGIWSVEVALVMGILLTVILAWKPVSAKFNDHSKSAIAGSMLATINTASEYGFGSVIAALPGFMVARDALSHIPNPLVNEAITVTTLAGITGSASGGMGIALAAMANTFKDAATAAHIPFEMLHRVASMASGGMDTLPHNGAVITLLMVTGLTHRQSYKDIFALTIIKTSAAFVAIAIYYLTGLV